MRRATKTSEGEAHRKRDFPLSLGATLPSRLRQRISLGSEGMDIVVAVVIIKRLCQFY